MNIGLVTSYIVAGIILLSMLMMNLRVSNSSAELTMTQITRERVASIADMLIDDIPNMGYSDNKKTDDIILEANSSKIRFMRKINRHGSGSAKEIVWEFLDDEEVSSTKNPDDKVLARIVDSDTTKIHLGVTHFKLWYFGEHGLSRKPEDNEHLETPVSDLSEIKQIYVELEVQSPEQIMSGLSGNGRYIRSVWEKRFSPGNIE